MIYRTLSGLAAIALLALAACSSIPQTATAEIPAPDPSGWRLASGKLPTTAEFTALTASCQDRGGALDSCLADLGLKRAQ
jgi:hypothetical protein